MGEVWVMGDIHGAYKALEQCLIRSGFDYENDRLIQLGDIVDGYPDAFECVEELLKVKNLISITPRMRVLPTENASRVSGKIKKGQNRINLFCPCCRVLYRI